MAVITEKNGRRNRVQFSMSTYLYESYQQNVETAKQLEVVLDFNRDFEKWFTAQNEQVARELERIGSEKKSSMKPVSTARKQASIGKTSQHHQAGSVESGLIAAGEAHGDN